MDESVIKHLEQTTSLKMSAAMRLGIPLVQETKGYCGCALGTAYTYKTGRNLESTVIFGGDGSGFGFRIAAREFGVPEEIAFKVSYHHANRLWSRGECADWLEAQGY